MSNRLYSECCECGRQTTNLRIYNEVVGVKPCTVMDGEGRSRKSLEPVFTPEVDLCYPCFVERAKKYSQAEKGKA